MTGPARPRSRGFTLLELLIALAVLGSAFSVLLAAHASSTRMESEARNLFEANTLAREVITKTETNGLPAFGKDSGDFGDDFPAYKWEREVSETNPLPLFQDLKEVTVRVLWTEGKRSRSTALVFYYLRKDK